MTKKFWTFSLTSTTILMFLEEKETKLKYVELRRGGGGGGGGGGKQTFR